MKSTKKIIQFLIVIILLAFSGNTKAQSLLDDLSSVNMPDDDIKTSLFLTTRISNGQSLETAGSGELLMLIQHRFGNISNGLYDFFGLDLATMRLGFEYGLNDNITFSMGRSTFEKTYDLGIKVKILNQNKSDIPLTLSIFAGTSISTIKNFYPEDSDDLLDRSTYSGMIMVGRRFGRLSLQLNPTFIYNSYDFRTSGSILHTALGMGAKFSLTKRMDLSSEYYFGLSESGLEIYDPLSIGIDIDTGGHVFQLIFSNSTGMIEKSLLTNNTGSWTSGDIYFGFNLIRTFNLK